MLGRTFASLFRDPPAKQKLAELSGVSHTVLPTFALTTTSLRHLTKWFDRLEDIKAHRLKSHGNFISDPAAIGLVDSTKSPPILTPIGESLLSKRSALYGHSAEAEYELLKLLYFSGVQFPLAVKAYLNEKRGHMLRSLEQFSPAPSMPLFMSHPSLLVIVELVAVYPGVVRRFIQMPSKDLVAFAGLGERGMKSLCSDDNYPVGLNRLCRRISGDFTRAQDRRLHYIVSMCLLAIGHSIPANKVVELEVPYPFGNFLSLNDLFKLHAQYTRDLSIWFDGVKFLVSSTQHFASMVASATPLKVLSFRPQSTVPFGRGTAPPTSSKRSGRSRSGQTPMTIVVDQVLSERAEDLVERSYIVPNFGSNYVRAGHRAGEMLSLPDGMVPGADFYVVDVNANPTTFLEVKSIAGKLPADIALTRAEYLRACKCAQQHIPYVLVLVSVADGQWGEVKDFAEAMASAKLGEVVQFTVRVG